jgi:hypothetical protein
VPLPAVGGSRPVTPQGLHLATAFGDGVWGQEQERVEIYGVGVGFALEDRFEVSVSGYERTDSEPNDARPVVVRGKIRITDFMGGRASVGVHVAGMASNRQASDVQDERMTALDVAFPLAFYPAGGQVIDRRWSVYAAPRVVSQTFEDRLTGETTTGAIAGALVGVAARGRHIAVTGELNFARTPDMGFRGTTYEGGWILLPMARLSLILPLGD